MTSRDIDALIRRLDVDQKIAQLQGLSVYDLGLVDQAATGRSWDFGKLPELRPHGVGHLSMVWLLDPDPAVFQRLLGELQERARELSPFGIGALVHGEGVNGFLHESGTQFPTAWAQAATFAPELTRACAAITSAEMRQTGTQLCFAPVLDVARDPRWGRVHETYGEDPELISRMGIAFVRGINGEHGESGVAAVAKHFTGYGASEGGLNQAASPLGRRTIRDIYAEPFRRAITEAGLDLVMNSYNEIDGIPAAADPWLLTDLLRGELGLSGAVVSDYDSIGMLLKTYHTATRPAEAAVQALRAGLDVELPSNETFSSLGEALKEGLIDEEHLDRAVARVLRLKQRLGLVPELPSPATPRPVIGPNPGKDIAERAIVLLENDGTLPLGTAERDILVVGPAADEVRIHFGAYTDVANREVPLGLAEIMAGRVPEQVFTDLFQVRFPGIEPAFEAHARHLHPEVPTVLDALRERQPRVRYASLGSLDADAEPVDAETVRTAVGDADVVIAVVGERTGWVGNNTAGEGQTSARLELPGNQDALLAALAETGRPVVTVVVSGRPLLLADAAAASSAMVLAPLLGQYAGDAIARVLVGEVNPSGKLPSTFPRVTGQLPLYHGHHYGSGYEHPTGLRHGYGDLAANGPLYAFGHGLSYTGFSLELDHVGLATNGSGQTTILATCTVANTGTRDGATVVQLYGRDEAASVVRPVRQLLTFERVELAPGERRELTFEVPAARLAYTLPDGDRGVEPGEVTLMVAFASDDVRGTGSVSLPEVHA
ncbi:glycoside hydrolase family 3 N-terminal domain-containing protein [Amycolatopsis albispora]|uniref:Glycosyl hydrolase n=1 Tax=Amycolatopsis albispora TaxID=1804986 RepID=A0A344LB10_9PSEU|nr:glycoside hydrolase family 3 N-terminal domain-containing protein [Amycolatopsis albispora]AXB45234.1 glycosyl hydrolase [Amycolatopsis albispora]